MFKTCDGEDRTHIRYSNHDDFVVQKPQVIREGVRMFTLSCLYWRDPDRSGCWPDARPLRIAAFKAVCRAALSGVDARRHDLLADKPRRSTHRQCRVIHFFRLRHNRQSYPTHAVWTVTLLRGLVCVR